MNNQSILAIDLGSSYTKIGLRNDWNSEAELVRDMSLAPKEASFCIPSVVASLGTGNNRRWVIGIEAANLLPGPGVKIFRNWKAVLLNPEVAHALPASIEGPPPLEEWIEAAIQFFRLLRQGLRTTSCATPDLRFIPLRLCLPKLESYKGTGLILDCSREGGWTPALGRTTLYEPEANALGILSRGRNVTFKPRPADFVFTPNRSPNLRVMLEAPLMGPLQVMLKERRKAVGILVSDIGAFTSDFGLIRFDQAFWEEDSNRAEVISHSSPIGINDLDRNILEILPSQVAQAVGRLSLIDWEARKALLYKGQALAFLDEYGSFFSVGDGDQAAQIQAAIAQFADRVWAARERFIASVDSRSISTECLTGGGMLVPHIRNLFIERAGDFSGLTIHDLLDPSEPRKALLTLGMKFGEQDVENRTRQNHELVRCGTALGGCSVFFE